MTQNRIVTAIVDLKNRGIKTRLITEITKDNLSYCKELIKLTTEVRHLEDVKGNFTISDRSIYQATAVGDFSRVTLIEGQVEKLELEPITESIYRTMGTFVVQQVTFLICYGKRRFLPSRESRRLKKI